MFKQFSDRLIPIRSLAYSQGSCYCQPSLTIPTIGFQIRLIDHHRPRRIHVDSPSNWKIVSIARCIGQPLAPDCITTVNGLKSEMPWPREITPQTTVSFFMLIATLLTLFSLPKWLVLCSWFALTTSSLSIAFSPIQETLCLETPSIVSIMLLPDRHSLVDRSSAQHQHTYPKRPPWFCVLFFCLVTGHCYWDGGLSRWGRLAQTY